MAEFKFQALFAFLALLTITIHATVSVPRINNKYNNHPNMADNWISIRQHNRIRGNQ